MCPDSQLHSAFYDEEIPEPWNKRFADHVEHCPDCKARLASYKAISNILETTDPDCTQSFLDDSFARLTTKLHKIPVVQAQQKITPAGFVPIKYVKIAVAAVFFAAFLPASFFLGKITAEQRISADVAYYNSIISQQQAPVAFPPPKTSVSMDQAFTGIPVSNEPQAIPVFEPGHGIVIQNTEQASPMIIIRLPNPDFSAFAKEQQKITERR